MKQSIALAISAICLGTLTLFTPTSSAQGKAAKLEAISKQLDLTPQQKLKILPILQEEAPKVEAIKNDNSLSRTQKVQQIRAIHQQTDPQMKAVLTPAQYEKLKAIRQQAVRDATQTYR
jgi:Spy/CpxP family protein refolding chaperone